MIIWLVDFDGKMENLALMRLSAYHKSHGDSVKLIHGYPRPSIYETPDKVYISCIFSWNKESALGWANLWAERCELGGSGVDVKKVLPPEVARCAPDYSLYSHPKMSANTLRALGFISRGCTRSCPWCIVKEKEGELRRVSSAKEIVENFDSVLFLDNNFLALPDFELDLAWLVESGVSVDFNQGLDIRLVTENAAKLLSKCTWSSGVRFALDSTSYIDVFEENVTKLLDAGIRCSSLSIYALIGFSGLESDLKRMTFLHDLGVRVYPMGFRDLETGEEPARGWDFVLYKKYRRLITRMPFAKSVWEDFYIEVVKGRSVSKEKRDRSYLF